MDLLDLNRRGWKDTLQIMVEHKHVITYNQAREACDGQQYATAATLKQGPTKRPAANEDAIIFCRAVVAFEKELQVGRNVYGIPAPIGLECPILPSPNCADCKVAQLSHDLDGTPQWVAVKKYKKFGRNTFLAIADIRVFNE